MASTPGDAGAAAIHRPVLLVGDAATIEASGRLVDRARDAGLRISQTASWPVGELDDGGTGLDHPRVVESLLAAARAGVGVWIPFPGDLGNPSRLIGYLAIALGLGIDVFVDGSGRPWQRTLLPGLAMNHVVAVVGVAWMTFIATAGGTLLATSLIQAATAGPTDDVA